MNEEVRQSYTNKINEQLTQALSNWWNNLTKEEILAYLANQPTVTADSLRSLLAETDTNLVFVTNFMAKDVKASVDFNED